MSYLVIENFSRIWRHHHFRIDGMSVCNIGVLHCLFFNILGYIHSMNYNLHPKSETGHQYRCRGRTVKEKDNDYRDVGQKGKIE